ncbi:MAG: tRNA 2-thiouridine(34) synthase MnmA [Nitrospirota bacterium]
MPKVLVGMSGGVDSSVAAYLLKEKGYEVEGLSLILWEERSRTDFKTCCSLQAIKEASRTARHIGVPHNMMDVRDDFIKKVTEPFVNAYTAGSTPNPCILCNRFIKFPFLIRDAEKRGAEYVATGHYARIERQGSRETSVFLKKGIDPKKDQSYVLYILRQEELKKLILPLGYYRKDEVREIAKGLNLPATKRSESQEVCFIENRNYFKFIEKLSPLAGKPGPIIDMTGRVIGTHKGIHTYTVGQRKRIGISSKEPFYVVKIDTIRNTVYVGTQEAVKKREFFVEDLNWILLPPSEKFKASVKVRSMMKDEPATISLLGDKVSVVYDKPQWAPAPGQSAVFYDGDTIIGGGVIKTTA